LKCLIKALWSHKNTTPEGCRLCCLGP